MGVRCPDQPTRTDQCSIGKAGVGQNQLGKLLMELRADLCGAIAS